MKGSVSSGASLETPDSTQSLPISLWVDISHRDDPKQPELLRDLKRDGSLFVPVPACSHSEDIYIADT